MRLPGTEGRPPRILHGVIDLAFREETGRHVVDWKTDRLGLDALAARYADQVRQHAGHWAALTGAPVACARLFAVREGRRSAELG